MAYNEKELEQMIKVVKNLKKERKDNQIADSITKQTNENIDKNNSKDMDKDIEENISNIRNRKKDIKREKNVEIFGDIRHINREKDREEGGERNRDMIDQSRENNRDRSFYSRIFHQDKKELTDNKLSDNQPETRTNSKNNNLSPLRNNNFSIKHPRENPREIKEQDIDELVHKAILKSVENPHLIKEIIDSIIQEYKGAELQKYIMNEVEKLAEEIISERVNEIMKDVMHRIGKSLIINYV